jgi:hypothetical protein
MAKKIIFKKIHVNSRINFSNIMKKRIYLLLLSVSIIFFSCKDNSGEFVEQLFTDNEISIALSQCIDSAAFYTCNALCVTDTLGEDLGYYYFDSKSYRLELPAAAKIVVDTLIKYGSEAHIDSLKIQTDSLVFLMNYAAEQCGNALTGQFWKPLSSSIVFSKPNAILHGDNNAITGFVKQTKQTEFISILVTSILLKQFNALNINNKWNELQKKYTEITGVYSSIDILTPTAQQMVTGFLKKMAIEEEMIRKNPDLWGSPKGIFYRVFETQHNP